MDHGVRCAKGKCAGMGVILHGMSKPRRQVRWELVPAQVNMYGNKVANGLAMEGMCSNPLWSGKRHYGVP